jgi:hypothetical protein
MQECRPYDQVNNAGIPVTNIAIDAGDDLRAAILNNVADLLQAAGRTQECDEHRRAAARGWIDPRREAEAVAGTYEPEDETQG